MWIGFLDQDDRIEHNDFQKWRLRHRTGFILRFTVSRRAYVHKANCRHFGEASIRYNKEHGSLTSQLKVCHVSQTELEAWARRYDVDVTQCTHCLGRKF
jgi:hypothetical protein